MFLNKFQKALGFWNNVSLREQLSLFLVRGSFTNDGTKIIRLYVY